MSAPNGFLLVHQIKQVLKEWEAQRDRYYKSGNCDREDELQNCIDDLKGILPPEEET